MKICIVTTRHISYNPRVLKEADALHKAGHDVAVVTVNNNIHQSELDAVLMPSRQWSLKTVNYRKVGWERLLWAYTRLRQLLFQKLLTRVTNRFNVAEKALGREFSELRSLAATVKADLYVAHHAETLGAAWYAARKNGGKLAFDAEDFHSAMHDQGVPMESIADESLEASVDRLLEAAARQKKRREQMWIEYVEQKYLPKCMYISAASKGIALAYQKKYSLRKKPKTILNVFPLESLPTNSTFQNQHSTLPTLYWYSQVIGPGRGLETAVRALALLSKPCELHLRGRQQPEFTQWLLNLANSLGVHNQIHLHDPCPPDDLIAEASKYDIGLALETGKDFNNKIAVSNKIFTYLNAGLAVVASNTPAQSNLAKDGEGGIRLCRAQSAESLACEIQFFQNNAEALQAAKNSARAAAIKTFNWESESKKLLSLIGTAQ